MPRGELMPLCCCPGAGAGLMSCRPGRDFAAPQYGGSRSGWLAPARPRSIGAARIGDGFLVSGRTQTDTVQIKAKTEAKLAALGRDRKSIQHYSRGDNWWPGSLIPG